MKLKISLIDSWWAMSRIPFDALSDPSNGFVDIAPEKEGTNYEGLSA